MRVIILALLMMPLPALAGQAKAPAAVTLKAEERALRKELGAGPSEDDDVDLDANHFETWQALAANLEKQRRIGEAIEAMYQGAGEIPTRSADFRMTARWALQQAIAFEVRLRGPSADTVRQSWSLAVSNQSRRGPLDDNAADGMGQLANGYFGAAMRDLLTIGRNEEAWVLAQGGMRIATAFRTRPASADVQAKEMAQFRARRGWLTFFVRASYAYAANPGPDHRASLTDAERVAAAGDWAAAEARFRALLIAMPEPVVLTPLRARASRGLALALSAQGGTKLREATREQAMLLQRLLYQSWRGDPQLARDAEALATMLVVSGQPDKAKRLQERMRLYALGGFPPDVLRLIL